MKKNTITLLLLILSLGSSYAQLTPGIEWKFFEMAEQNRLNNKNQSAILDYEEAIRINPEHSIFYYGLADCYSKSNNLEKAIENFEKAIQLNPDCSRSYAQVLKLYERTNNNSKYINTLEKWSIHSNSIDEKTEKDINIVKAYLKECNYNDANSKLKSALNYNDKNFELYYLYAVVSNKLHLYKEAAISANKSLELILNENPTKASQIYYELGFAFHHLGLPTHKEKAFGKINSEYYNYLKLKLEPEFYTDLAKVYTSKLFDYDIAGQLLNNALKLNNYSSKANKFYAEITEERSLSSVEKSEYTKKLISLTKNTIKGYVKELSNNNSPDINTRKKVATEYKKLIRIYINNGDYDIALNTIKEASVLINAQAFNVKLNSLKAICIYKKGHLNDAITLLSNESQNNYLSVNCKQEYNFILGYLYQQQKAEAKAITAFKKALNGDSLIRNAAQYSLDFYKSNDCSRLEEIEGFVQK